MINIRMSMYFTAVALEIVILRTLCFNDNFVHSCKNLSEQPYGFWIKYFLPANDVERHTLMSIWSKPIDLDQRTNKLTYQKSRLLITLPFLISDMMYLGIAETFNISPSSLTLKKEKSVLFFITLVAVIVFR